MLKYHELLCSSVRKIVAHVVLFMSEMDQKNKLATVEDLEKALDELRYEIARAKLRTTALAEAVGAISESYFTADERAQLLRDYGFRVPMPCNPNLRYSVDVNVFELLKERKQLSTHQICEAFGTSRPGAIAAMKRLSETFPGLVVVQKNPIRPGSRKKNWVIRVSQ